MPNLLEKKISENEQVSIFPIHKYWLDIGQIDQLEKAKLDSKRLFE
jgi:NDP-sugar pyrophosphorylase family protein